MGEYLKNTSTGETVKIGTCKDMYYTTFNALRSAINAEILTSDGGCEAGDYLKPEHGLRYRFPFPDEDGIQIGDHEKYNRGYTVQIKKSFLNDADFQHKDVCVRAEGVDANIFIPCMYSEKFNLRTSLNFQRGWGEIEIVQQKQRNANGELGADMLWTVIRCKCCGAAVSVEPSRITEITDAILAQDKTEFGQKMIKRILDGYNLSQVITWDDGISQEPKPVTVQKITFADMAKSNPNIIIAKMDSASAPKAKTAKAKKQLSGAPYGMKF